MRVAGRSYCNWTFTYEQRKWPVKTPVPSYGQGALLLEFHMTALCFSIFWMSLIFSPFLLLLLLLLLDTVPMVHHSTELLVVQFSVVGFVKLFEDGVHLLRAQFTAQLGKILKHHIFYLRGDPSDERWRLFFLRTHSCANFPKVFDSYLLPTF